MEPTEGKLYAPADGKITVAFPTGHAYGLRTEDGLDLLMHIGMDTVELDGKHFTPRSLRATPSSAAMSLLSLIFRDQGSRLPAGHSAGYHELKKLAESVQDAQNSGAAVTNADSVLKVVLKAKANA